MKSHRGGAKRTVDYSAGDNSGVPQLSRRISDREAAGETVRAPHDDVSMHNPPALFRT